MEETYTSFNVDDRLDNDNTHLATQTLEGLDPSTLTPLSPQVISRQATINIGLFSFTKMIYKYHHQEKLQRFSNFKMLKYRNNWSCSPR